MADNLLLRLSQSRYRGCLLGLAVGDAIGTSVEFMPPGSFTPLTDMVGGGPFNLAPVNGPMIHPWHYAWQTA